MNITGDKNGVIPTDIKTNRTISYYDIIASDISTKSKKTVPWNTYMETLIAVTTDQLNNIKTNIIHNYNLDELQVESIGNLFNNTGEYKIIVDSNLKKIIRKQRFNSTIEFMLDFTSISNWVVEKIIEYNLDKVASAFQSQTKWYRQTLKNKILRQETKIAANRAESYICQTIAICKEKRCYTEYLKEWLRYLLSVPDALRELFKAVPDLLEYNKDFIKSNVKFRQTIKYVFNSDAVVQKDILDFVDEVITNKNNVVYLAPDALKNSARLLKHLFSLLNKHYDLNKTNKSDLDSITENINNWTKSDDVKIKEVLDAIVENMKVNLKYLSPQVQNEVSNAWSEIIAL